MAMRIDLFQDSKSPWYMNLGLRLIKMWVGAYPGPSLTISYRPDLFRKDFMNYIMRGMSGVNGWDKGHAELFAAFVSGLNACNF
ncbi:MAG TPA: hypothetical protein G4N92_05735 [Anaerolineae bacterium]|nr:hypothetical protein [Anaerolineae bacterium]